MKECCLFDKIVLWIVNYSLKNISFVINEDRIEIIKEIIDSRVLWSYNIDLTIDFENKIVKIIKLKDYENGK